jgi:hypothetical protein
MGTMVGPFATAATSEEIHRKFHVVALSGTSQRPECKTPHIGAHVGCTHAHKSWLVADACRKSLTARPDNVACRSTVVSFS